MSSKLMRVCPEFQEVIRDIQKKSGVEKTISKTTKHLAGVLRESYMNSAVIEKIRYHKSNRRGSVVEVITFLVLFFVLFITAMIVATAGSSLFANPSFNASLAGIQGGAGNTTIQKWNLMSSSGFDNMMVGVYFFGHIALIALATLTQATALFFVVNLIITMVFMVLAYLFRNIFLNIYVQMATTGFTKTAWIIDHLFLLEFFFIILLIFVIYKSKNQGDAF